MDNKTNAAAITGQPAQITEERVGTVGIIVLMVIIALFVLTQLYLAIPLLASVGTYFSATDPEAVSFALVTCFSLAYAGGFLFWGPISDHYGRRPIILIGLTALSISTFACGFAPSLPWLAGLRAIQGAAASSFAPVALAYLSEAVPVRYRALTIGAMSTSFLVAGIFGQVLAAWVDLHWGWSWVFLGTSLCLLLAIPLCIVKVKEVSATTGGHLAERFIALGKLVVRPPVLILSCAHITLLLSFVAMYTALGSHLNQLGLEPTAVILVRLVGLPGMFTALLVGWLAARLSMPGVAIAGYFIAAVGLVLEALLSQTLSGIAFGSLLFVTGIALAVPSMITQFGALAAPNRGSGMALNGFILFAGASIGPFIAIKIGSFMPVLFTLAVMLLLAALCVAGSAYLSTLTKKS